MSRSLAIVVALMCLGAAWNESRAGLVAVSASDFAPGDTILDFESNSTLLPNYPGVTFLSMPPNSSATWYNGGVAFESFGPSFGNGIWANVVSATYSALGLDLATPVEAIGGYLAKIPNFKNTYPDHVTVEFVDSSDNSLGSVSIALNATLDSPVFFGFKASAPISGLRLIGTNVSGIGGGGFFGADNIVYGSLQSSVPEPSSLLLGVVGFASAAALARCRGRKRRIAGS